MPCCPLPAIRMRIRADWNGPSSVAEAALGVVEACTSAGNYQPTKKRVIYTACPSPLRSTAEGLQHEAWIPSCKTFGILRWLHPRSPLFSQAKKNATRHEHCPQL